MRHISLAWNALTEAKRCNNRCHTKLEHHMSLQEALWSPHKPVVFKFLAPRFPWHEEFCSIRGLPFASSTAAQFVDGLFIWVMMSWCKAVHNSVCQPGCLESNTLLVIGL